MGYPSYKKLEDFTSYMLNKGYGFQTISRDKLRIKLITFMEVTTDTVIENYIHKLIEMGYMTEVKRNIFKFGISEERQGGVREFE